MLYRKSKIKEQDKAFVVQVKEVMKANPAYGARRIAISLDVNKKRVSRIMRAFNLKPARRRKKPRKPNDINQAPTQYTNLIKKICPIKPNIIWVGDFTYIWYQNKFRNRAQIILQFSAFV